eukprot:1797389-Prymnesium_polylepis.3
MLRVWQRLHVYKEAVVRRRGQSFTKHPVDDVESVVRGMVDSVVKCVAAVQFSLCASCHRTLPDTYRSCVNEPSDLWPTELMCGDCDQ